MAMFRSHGVPEGGPPHQEKLCQEKGRRWLRCVWAAGRHVCLICVVSGIVLAWAGCGWVQAGVYYSAEKYAPLPSRWRGFLLDHRALRMIAVERPAEGGMSPWRQEYWTALRHYQQQARQRSLGPEESADYGAVLIRLGRSHEALAVLAPAARRWPECFALHANLGTAWQLQGEWDRAIEALQEAVRLAPPAWKLYEEYHLKLVRLRRSERPGGVAQNVDDLFGVSFDGPVGPWPESRRRGLPVEAVAIAQQLALWLPQDGRLLWLLAELANADGEVILAAAMLDGCVTEFGLNSPALRARRQLFRREADRLRQHGQHMSRFRPRSSRPLLQAFDERLLPPPSPDGPTPLPWPLLAATSIDPRGTVHFPDYLRRLDGRLVSLNGFMHPLGDQPQTQEFLLLEYPVGCWFCETPEPNGLVYVRLSEGRQIDKRRELIHVTGRLRLNNDNPEAFLFTLEDAVVALPQ